MKKIKVNSYFDIPKNFTGMAEYSDGSKEWYKNGVFHRDGDDKPAIILSSGSKSWFKNGKRHRGNGKPAIILADGMKKYWINGEEISKEAAEVYAGLFSEEERKE